MECKIVLLYNSPICNNNHSKNILKTPANTRQQHVLVCCSKRQYSRSNKLIHKVEMTYVAFYKFPEEYKLPYIQTKSNML